MTDNSESHGLSVSALRSKLENKIPVAVPGTSRPIPPKKPSAVLDEIQMGGDNVANSPTPPAVRRGSVKPPLPPKPNLTEQVQRPEHIFRDDSSSTFNGATSNSTETAETPKHRDGTPRRKELLQPPASIPSDDSSSIASSATLNLTGANSTTSASSEVDDLDENDDFDPEPPTARLRKTSVTTHTHNAMHAAIMDELNKKGILLRRRVSSTSSTRSSQQMEGFSHDIPPGIGSIRPVAKKGRPHLKEASGDDAQVSDGPNTDSAAQPRIYDSGYQTNSIISEQSVSSAVESKEEERLRRLQCAAKEIYTTERNFTHLMYDMFKVYPAYLKDYSERIGRPLIQESDRNFFDNFIIYLSQIYAAHNILLEQFDKKIADWDSHHPNIASVLTKHGDILKICNTFLKEKQTISAGLRKMMSENKDFDFITRQFEVEMFKHIPLVQQLDSVHQNVVRYKLLLENYYKYLPEQSEEQQETLKAIEKLTVVSNKVNESVADSEASKRLVDLHRRLHGHVDVFKLGRKLIIEGSMMKQSRKEPQPRYLVLFNDLLLIWKQTLGSDFFDTRPYQISMERVKIVNEEHEEFENAFQVRSHVKSFSFIAKDKHERDRWVRMLREAKRATKKRNPKTKPVMAEDDDADDDFLPLWIPDQQATKCLMETCTTEFSVIKRRHHCRACGYLICGNCVGKAPIKRRGFVKDKVCPQCYYDIEQACKSDIEQASSSPDFFTNDMLHREVGTDGQARVRIRYGEGANTRLIDLNKLLVPPKSGPLKKLTLPSLHRVCGKVHVRVGKGEQIKWAALSDGMVLQFFNAPLDETPSELHIILGFDMSTEEVENGRMFSLRHRNQFQTDRKDQVITFRVEHSGSAEKWLKALTDGLTPQEPNGHTPEH